MSETNSDRIEKQILLRSPRSRVWRALTDADEFGAWFRVKLQGGFAGGEPVKGQITYPGYEHLAFEVTVERMEAEQLFSYRWRPYSVDPKVDNSKEATTLVEFRLEEAEEGTLLTLVESGFDQIPKERRAEAYRRNSQGWAEQMQNIQRHVEGQ